jgi:hypothetical protein
MVGEVLWQRGLLVKGNGLCHGIAGNGFLLHSLYRVFDDLSRIEEDDEDAILM